MTLDGATDRGIWALRQDGAALWTREEVATLTTTGAEVTYALREGGTATYGYTVEAGVWTLLDPASWACLPVHRPRDAARRALSPTSAAFPPPP